VKVDLREFRAAYLAEVEEHIGAINTNLIRIETANRSKQTSHRELRELMRLFHTIKGLSGMVSVDPIVDITHRIESVLRNAERGSRSLTERELEAIISGTRAIEVAVATVAKNQPVAPMAPSLLAELDAVDEAEPSLRDGGGATIDHVTLRDPVLAEKLTDAEREQLLEGARAGRRAVRVDFAPSTARAERGLTITSLRQRLAAIGELVRVLPLTAPATDAAPGGLLFALVLVTAASNETVAEVGGLNASDVSEVLEIRMAEEEAPPPPFLPSPPKSDSDVADTHRSGVLRVEVERIDDTIDRLSALIVTRSRLSRVAFELREKGADTRDLDLVVAETTRQLRDLRAAVLQLRMVPVASILDRLPLVIRGLGRSAGKQVQLLVDGAGAELDKTVAERIFPALVHLLRNAVDHGIETPSVRRSTGKPEVATISVVSSVRNNRQLEIRIEDDGAGVDRARVAAKLGREVPEDDAALLEMLCRPGFSTREEADLTSGRGVGMDVVRKVVVDGLGGELVLETTAGRGTAFTMRVPLTIAIVDSFMLRCAGERFVVPVPAVEEIVEIDPTKIVNGPRVGGATGRFFPRRGEPVALIELARALGLQQASANVGGQALVVRRGREAPLAFAVDRVVAQQETVIRPLLDPLVSVVGVSGSTDLGDGRATLVLDLLAIGAKLGRSRERAA
jgi:two-component system chemotaxis sensor kinase CheA